ncbi:hypothetical protein DBR42_25080 [Pelomonas sp. HMWF004]|nr:hypothetical protein DBR42_25080 [Pelomonas sp. HMWF004]
MAEAPPHWFTLATPVPPEQGRTRVADVQIERLRARGAEVAFEVDACAEAPLQRFRFSALDIEARRGGHVQDAEDWRFGTCRLVLGQPIAVGASVALQGLDAAAWQVDPALQRRDVSARPMAEQDVL